MSLARLRQRSVDSSTSFSEGSPRSLAAASARRVLPFSLPSASSLRPAAGAMQLLKPIFGVAHAIAHVATAPFRRGGRGRAMNVRACRLSAPPARSRGPPPRSLRPPPAPSRPARWRRRRAGPPARHRAAPRPRRSLPGGPPAAAA